MPELHPDALLDGLDGSQRAAVTAQASPLCILAGAGSGKTRVLTRRIAWRIARGEADAQHVLALTFTRKAAGELGHRLRALGVRDRLVAGTFHGVAYAQLRRLWADRGEQEPVLLDRKVRVLAPLVQQAVRRAGGAGARGGRLVVQPADVAGEIEWAKARLVSPERYAEAAERAERRPALPAAAIADIYRAYEEHKRERHLVDFDDLLWRAARAIETDPDVASVQRWRFRHLFVDEFQDVNPVQHRLLMAWLGDRTDLCVVGDPNQAIYAWNGAHPAYLTRFHERWPDAAVVKLSYNHRSTPEVVAVAHAALRSPEDRPTTTRGEGKVPEVRSFSDDVAEARGVARLVRDRHRPGEPWSHIAVLFRTNAQAALFEEAFRAAGIPYRTRGGVSLLDQPEVRQAIGGLRRTPPTIPLASALADVEAEAAEAPEGDERRSNLEALVRLGHDFVALDPLATGEGFAAWVTATLRGEGAHIAADAVELTTFHRAKGLEWPIVIAAGLERGLVPIGQAKGEAIAEERRLLYVALSRAVDELVCTWAQRRTLGSRTVDRTPSPWLADVEDTCRMLAAGEELPHPASAIAAARAALDAGRDRKPPAREKRRRGPAMPPPDAGVLDALKTWRSTRARAAKVPAYVVFPDATLEAVAAALPRERSALLDLPGIGPVKAERYGEELLAVVAQHVGGEPAA